MEENIEAQNSSSQESSEREEETVLAENWNPSKTSEDGVSSEQELSDFIEGHISSADESGLKNQVKEEGKKFFYLSLNLMADPQKEIRSMYEKKPSSAFGIVILLNTFLVAFYNFSSSQNILTEIKVSVLGTVLIFLAIFIYLRMREPKTQWSDSLAVLGIANFPLLPCVLLADLLSLAQFKQVAKMFYTTGAGFSYMFVFLCFIEIFKLPVKLSIYTIPAIFVGSEAVARAIFSL